MKSIPFLTSNDSYVGNGKQLILVRASVTFSHSIPIAQVLKKNVNVLGGVFYYKAKFYLQPI